MLDLRRMERVKLSANPRFQKVVGALLLAPNYYSPPQVRIEFEGIENLPDEPVVFAMNHTDMYNYWPFQFRLWRKHNRFTATWVKGKYYENPMMGRFMEACNTIPAVSRGYLITRDFISTMHRRPAPWEYRALRSLVEAELDPDHVVGDEGDDGDEAVDTSNVPRPILGLPRDMLGHPFDPRTESYAAGINALMGEMNAHFVRLNEQCFDLGLDLIIFPQGTRSIALPRGHIGLGQVALRYKRTVVPIGCNGSDRCYNSPMPFARPGRIVYRFGKPIPYDEMSEFHIDEDYVPFTPDAEREFRPQFQGYVDVIMDRINELLDPRYQYSDDLLSDGVRGSSRFV